MKAKLARLYMADNGEGVFAALCPNNLTCIPDTGITISTLTESAPEHVVRTLLMKYVSHINEVDILNGYNSGGLILPEFQEEVFSKLYCGIIREYKDARRAQRRRHVLIS